MIRLLRVEKPRKNYLIFKEDSNMEIIKKTEGLTSADLYALTKGNDVRKMADAKGEVLDVLKYVLYKDEDVHGNPGDCGWC